MGGENDAEEEEGRLLLWRRRSRNGKVFLLSLCAWKNNGIIDTILFIFKYILIILFVIRIGSCLARVSCLPRPPFSPKL